jgi:ribosomal protein L13
MINDYWLSLTPEQRYAHKDRERARRKRQREALSAALDRMFPNNPEARAKAPKRWWQFWK